MKKTVLATSAYLICFLFGVLFYVMGCRTAGNVNALLINIAATFFAIPILFLSYETVKERSHRKLNKELFDYVKMCVDSQMLAVVAHLNKVTFPYDQQDRSPGGVSTFLSMSVDQLAGILQKGTYLGFQIFKHWEVTETAAKELLENPLVLRHLTDAQAIPIVEVLKTLRHLESLQNHEDLYVSTGVIAKGYRVSGGREINPENGDYPERYLLLRHLPEDRFQVADFGDFKGFHLPKLLHFYTMNPGFVRQFADSIKEVSESVLDWLSETGNEFVLDSKAFRVRLIVPEAGIEGDEGSHQEGN